MILEKRNRHPVAVVSEFFLSYGAFVCLCIAILQFSSMLNP